MTNFDTPKLNQDLSKSEGGGNIDDLSSDLETRIRANLKAENKEGKIPEIKIHIFFGAHGSAEEAEMLRGPLKDADIYLPEMSGWNPNFRYALEDLIRGRKTTEMLMREQGLSSTRNPMFHFMRKQFDLLYNSNKLVSLVDLSRDNPLHEKLAAGNTANIEKAARSSNPTFGKFVQAMRADIREESDLHSQREDIIVVSLDKKIQSIIKEHPELTKKDKISVLVFLGSYHTRVHHILKKGGRNVSREFNVLPQIYNFHTEAMRSYTFGKEVSFELAARALMENYITGKIQSYLQSISTSNIKIILYLRRIVEKFTLEEIREIIESENRDLLFSDALMKKGILQPQCEADLDTFNALK